MVEKCYHSAKSTCPVAAAHRARSARVAFRSAMMRNASSRGNPAKLSCTRHRIILARREIACPSIQVSFLNANNTRSKQPHRRHAYTRRHKRAESWRHTWISHERATHKRRRFADVRAPLFGRQRFIKQPIKKLKAVRRKPAPSGRSNRNLPNDR